MFVGHFGLGFAAKRIAPAVSLGSLFLAVEFADGLWPIFLLAGVEHVRIVPGLMKTSALDFYDYPWSHSLIALVIWAAIVGAAYFAASRSRRGAWVVAALVLSHWFLDVCMHRPDMPVLPGGPFVGLSLWNSVPATLLIECGLYAWGVGLYLQATRPRDRTGTISLWALVLFVLVLWLAALFGPPPPDVRALAIGGLSGWLLIAWGYWIDRHRAPRIAGRT